jgi:hypothetical protein
MDYKITDCITGLIGMRAYFVKKIGFPEDDTICVEWKWAEVTYSMNDEKIYKVDKLGIYMCPGDNYYFLV